MSVWADELAGTPQARPHLTGDMHQPLHAADNADRGGNEVTVVLADVRTRGRETRYRAWDNDSVRLALGARGGQRPPAELGALVRGPQTLFAEAAPGDAPQWLTESHHLARNLAYRYPGFACGAGPRSDIVLDEPTSRGPRR